MNLPCRGESRTKFPAARLREIGANDRPPGPISPALPAAAGLALGVMLEWLVPLGHRLDWFPTFVRGPLAVILLLAGAALSAGGHAALKRTGIRAEFRPTTAPLVESWPFSWTRNPMCLGGGVAFLGLGLAFRLCWLLMLFPLLLAIVHRGVVLREEEHLRRKFGARYLRYKARVRRWL